MQLTILDAVPEPLLQAAPTELYRFLPGPTLITLEGRRPEPLFVSVLLHGNETTGYFAVQELLRKYVARQLPRSLAVFIGNLEAARHGLRRLDNQVDYNRIWPHPGFTPQEPEAALAAQVVEHLRGLNVFLCIDIHNNTGLNPHYACINRREQAFYQLATLFSRTVIYFLRPLGVLSHAFAPLCPAVTIECGKTEHLHGITHALQYLEACLELDHLPQRPVAAHDIDLFHTVATVKIPPEVEFYFDGAQATEGSGVEFVPGLEKMNFSELAPNTVIARVPEAAGKPLSVVNEQGEEVFEHFFTVKQGYLLTKTATMPSMLTTNTDVVRKDCLCYLMERLASH